MNRRTFFKGLAALAALPLYVSSKRKTRTVIVVPEMGVVCVNPRVHKKHHYFRLCAERDDSVCSDCGMEISGTDGLEGMHKFGTTICDDRIGKWRRAYGRDLFKESPFEQFIKNAGEQVAGSGEAFAGTHILS